MKRVAIYILATDKNINRLKLLCEGSIRCLKNSCIIVLLGDGAKPKFLSKNMKWIDLNHIRLQDKHIYALYNNHTEKADYHLFTDDDVMVDVDKMVSSIQSQNIPNTPCYWSGSTGMTISHQPEVINFMVENKLSNDTIERCKQCWTGWCFTLINNAFVERIKKSHELELVMKMSKQIYDKFWPDRQIPILGALIGAKHYYGSVKATQWKNYFNYSGLVDNGEFWHIHYTVDNNILDYKDLLYSVKNGPKNINEAITSLFKSKLSRKICRKNIVNKTFSKNIFFVPWGYGGWHSPVPDGNFPSDITFLSDGKCKSKDTNMNSWTWEEQKKGFVVFDISKNPIFDIRWIFKGNLVGRRIGNDLEPVLDSFHIKHNLI